MTNYENQIIEIIKTHFQFTSIIEIDRIFIAYNGVLTIAFKSYTKELLQLKSTLEQHVNVLSKENIGTKWLKITIACLNQNHSLTLEQFRLLHQLTIDFTLKFHHSSSKRNIRIDQLSVINFNNRALIPPFNYKIDIPTFNSDQLDNLIDHNNHNFVSNQILGELSNDLDIYWRDKVNYNPKNSNKSSHYIDQCEPESTLVHQLSSNSNNCTIINEMIDQFRQSLPVEISNLYHWFPKEYLHISIRSLIPTKDIK
ncbi:hypothetical protein DLAC_00405 [Tieghemostelium lacteum]|uniref:Uncharacterized protein n=1 Tax=Tieghemostelium lacteum TaxID=361077 RepID=A0A152A9W2_TIELA|nr:hypothetical protein DLAC_00405 [Tieghemostelium lacteum]|eukprot:KYR02925.1 hypothetical protein DLAC_00405 [Tieghemostelium lacteum]